MCHAQLHNNKCIVELDHFYKSNMIPSAVCLKLKNYPVAAVPNCSFRCQIPHDTHLAAGSFENTISEFQKRFEKKGKRSRRKGAGRAVQNQSQFAWAEIFQNVIDFLEGQSQRRGEGGSESITSRMG